MSAGAAQNRLLYRLSQRELFSTQGKSNFKKRKVQQQEPETSQKRPKIQKEAVKAGLGARKIKHEPIRQGSPASRAIKAEPCHAVVLLPDVPGDGVVLVPKDVGAFSISIGFWGILYHTHNKEPPK